VYVIVPRITIRNTEKMGINMSDAGVGGKIKRRVRNRRRWDLGLPLMSRWPV